MYAGFVDATIIKALQYVASGSSGQFLAYTSTPALGNLDVSISPVSGTDSLGNAYAAGIEIQSGGLTLDNQGSAPPAVTGASTFYSSVAGRPRYLSSAGADSVIERSEINVSQFACGNTGTSTNISAPLAYKAGEASQSSEYMIEATGAGTPANVGQTAQTLDFRIYMDGSNIGPVLTVGASFWQLGQAFVYTVRFRVSVTGSGAGGTAFISSGGTISWQTNKTTSDAATLDAAIDNVAIDFTANHTFQLKTFWGNTSTGQALTTYRTQLTRRM